MYIYIYIYTRSTRFSPASKIHERRIAVLSATHDRRRLSILPANDLQQQKMDKEKKKKKDRVALKRILASRIRIKSEVSAR